MKALGRARLCMHAIQTSSGCSSLKFFQHIDDKDTVTEGAPKTGIDRHIGEAVQPIKAVCGAGLRF